MSEEILSADALLNDNVQLRARIDRLAAELTSTRVQLAEETGQLNAIIVALRKATTHALRALAPRPAGRGDLTHDEERLRAHLTSALATDAGDAVFAELAAGHALATEVDRFLSDISTSPLILGNALTAYELACAPLPASWPLSAEARARRTMDIARHLDELFGGKEPT